ncbi:MAG: SpoIID/LytB domain-containing protein [Calditrichaeota bacterium]|nr:MAG: SpoIID/LytB domain-containing protein [Calditrichota bacterium]
MIFKNKMRYVLVLLLCLVLIFGCSAPSLSLQNMGRQAQIRVGLLQKQKIIQFMVSGRFAIYGPDNRFIGRGMRGIRWQARALNFTPATIVYRLRYAENVSRSEAEKNSRSLKKLNLRSEILPTKNKKPNFSSNEKRYDVLLWSTFPNAVEAATYRAELGKSFPLEIIEDESVSAGGQIEIFSKESPKKYQVPNGTRIHAEKFALLNMDVGNGFHFEGKADNVFRGLLELRIDEKNQLSAVNIVDTEDYLRGVVPAEMPFGFPAAALEAQAIAARSEVLVKVERGAHQKEGFDICATVHCQVYGGVSKEQPSTDQAVKKTYGRVLKTGGRVIDAVYSAVCGGHTENNENVWLGTPQPYLRGRFDGRGAADLLRGRLQEHATVKKWIDNKAPVFCNTLGADTPQPLLYTQKYFRWQASFTRYELERSITKATGKKMGVLRTILPLERGVSGRIKRLQIIGSAGSFTIEKDLTIRRAMSDSTLYSSCFVVTPELDEAGTPVRFNFRGAGWGHGVGMCQAGAARLAQTGKTMVEILGFYYQNTDVERVY